MKIDKDELVSTQTEIEELLAVIKSRIFESGPLTENVMPNLRAVKADLISAVQNLGIGWDDTE